MIQRVRETHSERSTQRAKPCTTDTRLQPEAVDTSLHAHLVVLASVGLGALRVELDGGEAAHVEPVNLVASAVHLGDDDVVVAGEVLAQRLRPKPTHVVRGTG